jgi:demethylmenaquinone methyltransferase/2-methoxy-6-polyprenyl-1,4-benzoquinol methylase
MTTQTATASKPTESESWKMFDRIAYRYDLLNRLLSFRQDVIWRKRMCNELPAGKDLRVLDLATGTGDVLLSLYKQSGRIKTGVGLDKSSGMLSYGHQKIKQHNPQNHLSLIRGDAMGMGIQSDYFDATSIAFGIRNVPDVPSALNEMYRVLKPGGRTLILEFSLPANRIIRTGYLMYFRHVLPRVGGIVSGDSQAYRYLNETVEQFPYGEAFAAMIREAGFHQVKAIPLTFGIATLYLGDKEA